MPIITSHSIGRGSETPVELREMVHQHSLFFDKLVDMIPAKYYIPSEEQQESWKFGMNKAQRAARKKQTRENLKLAKRNRLDPDKFVSTSQMLQQQGSAEEKAEPAPALRSEGAPDRAVTREQLVERLNKRIAMLRAKRHIDEAAAAAKNAQKWQTEKKKESKKRKQPAAVGATVAPSNGANGAPPGKRQKPASSALPTSKKQVGQPQSAMEFGRVKMGLDTPLAHKKPMKMSKEQLLAKATAIQNEMQDPNKGQEVVSKHSWSAAVSRASGEKVLDDPKLLKRSLKKEKYQRHKSAQKWQDRKDTERKFFQEKQQKRKEHISQRIETKKDRSIAKREKKLLRPGFEGRKEGFINS